MNKDDREVCEAIYDSLRNEKIRYITECRRTLTTTIEYNYQIRSFMFCPYCGKPIKIKGDK